MPDQPIDFIGAEVDSRTDELTKEFIEHRDECIRENPTQSDPTVLFQCWAMQKIAGLQLQAEKNVVRICQLESRK